jgi:ribosomal-protein-alanine N-acetyltransferase
MNIQINYSHFEKFPELESERLYYRKLLISDAEDFLKIRSNDEVMKYMDNRKMTTVSEAENFISSVNDDYLKKSGIAWAIIEKSSKAFIGSFEFWKIKPEHCRAEIGYALNHNYWKNGYMSETFKTMIDFGFNQLRLHSIEANVNPQNEKSIKVLEKSGFKAEAYFKEDYLFNGKYLDSKIYSLLEPNV